MKKFFAGLILLLCCVTCASGTCLGACSVPARANNQVQLVVDGNLLELNSPIFIFNGRAMISLSALAEIFECEAFAQPSEIKIISRDTFITMFPGRTDYQINSEARQSDTPPLITETGEVYIPLRLVAQEISFDLTYDPYVFKLYLQSPEYSEIHPLPPAAEFKPAGDWGPITGVVPSCLDSDELIAGYFTRLINSPKGRTTNIAISCSRINGKILQPGEVFSFNQTVGTRTADAGYQIAAVFAGKKVIQGIGGGICQTATTLYNLTLEAGLQVIERHPHSLKVIYAAPGRDATVSWGTADLRFANTFPFPVKILCKVESDLVITALVREPK